MADVPARGSPSMRDRFSPVLGARFVYLTLSLGVVWFCFALLRVKGPSVSLCGPSHYRLFNPPASSPEN